MDTESLPADYACAISSANDTTLWQGGKIFLPHPALSEDDDETLSDLEHTSKPRPTPEYPQMFPHDWSLFSSSCLPEDPAQPSSSCPSLMSTSTLSSRNSSTRSTMSLASLKEPVRYRSHENPNKTLNKANSRCQVTQSETFTAQVVGSCPWKSCERHLKGFTKAGDRERHLLTHYKKRLICDFCLSSGGHLVSFGRSTDHVSEFLTHLIRMHGANEVEDSKEPPIHPIYMVPTESARWYDGGATVAKCPICRELFTAGFMCEHLPDCIRLEVTKMAESSVQTHQISNDLECSTSDDAMTDQVISVAQPNARKLPTQDVQGDPYRKPEPLHAGCDDITELTASSSALSLVSSRAATSSEEETDYSEELPSRESSPTISQVPRQIMPAKRRLVDAIMQKFHQAFRVSAQSHTTDRSNSSSSGSAPGRSTGASAYSDASFVSRKRSLSGGGFTPPDDGDDSNKRRRSDSVSKGKQPTLKLRFACPYYKRNPGRHQTFTSCRDPGFTTVARLKEHLYRRHLLPPQCHRCCTTFADDIALREHQRDPTGCRLQEQIPLEGFDKEQEKKMKSKKGSQMHHNEVEKWEAVYRILFPDDHEADMPSPYIEYQRGTPGVAEPSSGTRFQEFSRLELPRLVRRTLESIVEHEAQPLEDRLKERLVDIVRQCQTQLETMFQTALGPSNTTAEASLSSRAQSSEHTIGRPIDTGLPTTFGLLESANLQTPPEDIPPHLQTQETSSQGETLLETADRGSDHSDSGYDSTSLAALSATDVHNDLPLECFDPNQYLDFSDYSQLPEATTGTAAQLAQTHAHGDLPVWPYINSFPVMSNANLAEPDNAHESNQIWQY